MLFMYINDKEVDDLMEKVIAQLKKEGNLKDLTKNLKGCIKRYATNYEKQDLLLGALKRKMRSSRSSGDPAIAKVGHQPSLSTAEENRMLT